MDRRSDTGRLNAHHRVMDGRLPRVCAADPRQARAAARSQRAGLRERPSAHRNGNTVATAYPGRPLTSEPRQLIQERPLRLTPMGDRHRSDDAAALGDRNRTGDVQLTVVSRIVTSYQNSSLPATRSVPASHDSSLRLTQFGQRPKQQTPRHRECSARVNGCHPFPTAPDEAETEGYWTSDLLRLERLVLRDQ
jgi:hypothetical protein